ncbi:MAG TPA: phytanoyl-CoA dioxygenase family protein [Candidatus Microsaccharimonas sp.]|nr:phytanoyl-CoA dioxygenase family protein [Candidatus Microsaccharimonas sp.]
MSYGSLSHEQARFFRNQGYFRLPDVFTRNETSTLRSFVSTEAATVTQPQPDNPNNKLYRLYERNPDLMEQVIRKEKLVGALVSLLGPNIVFVQNRHNHATLNSQQGAPTEGLHRDILQPTRGLITAAVYLQAATVENGATRFIPGSQDFPYVGVPQQNGGGTWLAEHEEYAGLEDQAIPVPMEEGSVLLFNGLAFHGVGGNVSGKPRMSMTLGFRSVDELSANPDIDREVLVTGQYIYRGNDIA